VAARPAVAPVRPGGRPPGAPVGATAARLEGRPAAGRRAAVTAAPPAVPREAATGAPGDRREAVTAGPLAVHRVAATAVRPEVLPIAATLAESALAHPAPAVRAAGPVVARRATGAVQVRTGAAGRADREDTPVGRLDQGSRGRPARTSPGRTRGLAEVAPGDRRAVTPVGADVPREQATTIDRLGPARAALVRTTTIAVPAGLRAGQARPAATGV
jgi:hypothetical protein